jgi:hypothetical protein
MSLDAIHWPGCICVTKLPWAVGLLPAAVLDVAEPDADPPEPEDIVPEPAEPDALGELEPAVDPEADVDPDPEEPEVELALPLGTMAGEPEVVEPEPEAAGRSDDGAVVDCA